MPLLARLKAQVRSWRARKLQLASKQARTDRLAVCGECQHGKGSGGLILGVCVLQSACCGRGQPAIAASVCPLKPPKWGPV